MSGAWIATEWARNPQTDQLEFCVLQKTDQTHVKEITSPEAHLSEDEAHAIALARETREALRLLLEEASESRLPPDHMRRLAWQTFLRSKGLGN